MCVCVCVCVCVIWGCRYSAKVDSYIDTMSACLKDESLLVRKQTLMLLANLLQASRTQSCSYDLRGRGEEK